MEKFIPYEKMSKRQKREQDSKRRKDWNGINPSSKIVPDTHKERRQSNRIKDAFEY